MTAIRSVMSRAAHMIRPDDSIGEAAKLMRDHDVGALPVADGDRLLGMVTDRDIVVRALAAGGSSGDAVKSAMSSQLLYCFEDQSCDEVAANMGRNGFAGCPSWIARSGSSASSRSAT